VAAPAAAEAEEAAAAPAAAAVAAEAPATEDTALVAAHGALAGKELPKAWAAAFKQEVTWLDLT